MKEPTQEQIEELAIELSKNTKQFWNNTGPYSGYKTHFRHAAREILTLRAQLDTLIKSGQEGARLMEEFIAENRKLASQLDTAKTALGEVKSISSFHECSLSCRIYDITDKALSTINQTKEEAA